MERYVTTHYILRGAHLLALPFVFIILKYRYSSLSSEVQITEVEQKHLLSSPISTAADKGHFAVSFLPDSILH